MRLLKDCGLDWLDLAVSTSSLHIEEGKTSVVGTCGKDIGDLLREGHGAEWRLRFKGLFWCVWVVEIPDVGLFGHVGRHLLESELSIGGSDSKFGGLWMPCDLSNRTFDGVGVLEDHNCLG